MSTTPSKTKVVTGKARLSYVQLFEPKADDQGKLKYSVAILIPKTDKATIDKINAAVEVAKQEGKAGKWGGKLPPNLKLPLRDGDTERDAPEYKGHYFINANSLQKPGVVDANVQPILDRGEVYSGCYGRVSLNFYPFDSKGNKGVGAGLQNVQKLADGEPLSGRSRAEDDFTAADEGFLD